VSVDGNGGESTRSRGLSAWLCFAWRSIALRCIVLWILRIEACLTWFAFLGFVVSACFSALLHGIAFSILEYVCTPVSGIYTLTRLPFLVLLTSISTSTLESGLNPASHWTRFALIANTATPQPHSALPSQVPPVGRPHHTEDSSK
jgi:hypothetical protein